MADIDYTEARTYVFPSNGWDVSYPDGRVPVHIEKALDSLCTSWVWLRNEFHLVLQDSTPFIWKRGHTIFVADETRLLKHLPNEEFWGFEMRDKGYLA